MNDIQRQWFFGEIKKNKGSDTEVSKEDIFNYSQELGLNLKASLAKTKIIDAIIENGFERRFYETFQEFMYIPEWDVRERLGLSKKQFSELLELGIITEKPILKEFKGASGRFKAQAYPLSVLEKDGEELKKIHVRAYSDNAFRVRIETNNLEEIKDITERLGSSFEIMEAPVPYEHRDKSGYYSYFKLRVITDDPIIQDAQLLKMAKLQSRIEELEKELSDTTDKLRASKLELLEAYGETSTIIYDEGLKITSAFSANDLEDILRALRDMRDKYEKMNLSDHVERINFRLKRIHDMLGKVYKAGR